MNDMYSKKVMEHFRNPHNVGEIINPDASSEVENPVCGDHVIFYLKINKDSKIITEIKSKTFGCAAAIACSSITTDLALGKHIDEAEKISKEQVSDNLGGLPPSKMHCSNLGPDALYLAIQNYKKKNNITPLSDITVNTKIKLDKSNEEGEDSNIEFLLDLRGKQCPLTFVYTKVALESIGPNQILKIILDFKPAFINVPESIKKQELGSILKEEEIDGIKTIWVKKI